ncbi:hypothetical protein [Eilatimonas milleporae]|uniref:Uncharacterized protein n=1 Tax=Eilatimonas milleporae TaxID=911205 RepID=A0A3M0CI41_9PROT|nr:hypothetical protein [Eilatimonas milleporae]RMB08437.1 hypothetical protein BXY39_1070 [Eilatimonas milleporae]
MISSRPALTPRQTVLSVMAGAVLWFLAALLLKVIGPMGAYEGINMVILYVLVIPVTVPFIPLVRTVAGLAHDQTALGIAMATAAAALLDGLALAWAPGLYGTETAYVAGAGATILWGAGVAIVLGFVMNRAS